MNGPVWLVSAGAWPRRPGPIPAPPPSATGKPLVAIGDVVRGDPVDPPHAPATFSLYLEREPAESLACALAGGMDRARAIDRVVHDDRWRVVRFAPLDVDIDPRLRVVQVITSLQLGGAERIALALRPIAPAARDRQPARHPGSIAAAVVCRSARDASTSRRRRLDPAARAAAAGPLARDFHADVIHAHLLDGGEIAAIAQEGIPVLVTVHNQQAGWPRGLETLGPGGAALLVACRGPSRTIWPGLQSRVPVRTAWNGIEPGAFQVDALAPCGGAHASAPAWTRAR